MRNAVEKLRQLAGAIRKGSGAYLSFFFAEEQLCRPRYVRRIKVPRRLEITPEIESRMSLWLRNSHPADNNHLRLQTETMDVILTWHPEKQHRYSYRSTMPPEVHDLVDNHLCATLERKAKQLRNAEFGGLRCLLLGDAGSTLLRRLDERDHLNRHLCGRQIIEAFLQKPDCGLDVVVVFSPHRHCEPFDYQERLIWKVSMMTRPGVSPSVDGVKTLANKLPAPRFEGYQARQLYEQGQYAPTARGWHLGTIWSGNGSHMTARISSRALLELLAGKGTRNLPFTMPPPARARQSDRSPSTIHRSLPWSAVWWLSTGSAGRRSENCWWRWSGF